MSDKPKKPEEVEVEALSDEDLESVAGGAVEAEGDSNAGTACCDFDSNTVNACCPIVK